MNNPRRTILIGFAAALMTGGVLYCSSAVWTRANRLAALRGEELALKARLQGDREQQLKQRLASLRDLAGVGVAPQQDQAASLLGTLTADLSDLNVKDRSLTTGTCSARGVVQEVPVTVAFKGSFAETFELLRRFNRYEQVVRMQRLALTREAESSDQALSVSLRLSTYASMSGRSP